MIITQHLQWVDTNISNIKYATEWTVIPFPHVEEEEERGDGWKGGSVINPTNLVTESNQGNPIINSYNQGNLTINSYNLAANDG